MQEGHVLKFVIRGKTFDQNTGIRTFPRQTYGVSQESPQEFHQQFTLTGDHGYIYKHQGLPQYYYPSQRKSFSINSGEYEEDYTRLHLRLLENSQAFHRKKGRLSEFMDKNGWMSPVIPIMGFERTAEARNLSNRDRQKRIRSLQQKPVFQHQPKTPKVNQEYFNTIAVLMSQKLKIRKERNLLNQHNPLTARSSPQKLQKKEGDPIQIENVVENMAKTSLDFYSTSSTFYKRNESRGESRVATSKPSKQSPSKLNFNSKTAQSPSYTSKHPSSPHKGNRIQDIIERQEQNLQHWKRQSCHDKWVFKPKDTDSDEQL